jgi:hypothetical protein
MKQFKIFGFENKSFNYSIIVNGESVDQVFKEYRKIYGYFVAVQPL